MTFQGILLFLLFLDKIPYSKNSVVPPVSRHFSYSRFFLFLLFLDTFGKGWKIRRLEGWKIGRLEGRKVGKLEGWKVKVIGFVISPSNNPRPSRAPQIIKDNISLISPLSFPCFLTHSVLKGIGRFHVS